MLAFAVVQGLYLAGLLLSKGMTFEFLEPELRSAFAPALSPEAANLGAFLWQVNHYGFGVGHPRPWPDGIVLGSMLWRGLRILNVLVMIQAHWDARGGAGERVLSPLQVPAVATGIAWLVPGLGHLVQGRRRRGLIVFGLLVGLFLVGTWLAEASNLSRERHFYYWAGQFVLGAPALLAELALGARRVTGPIAHMGRRPGVRLRRRPAERPGDDRRVRLVRGRGARPAEEERGTRARRGRGGGRLMDLALHLLQFAFIGAVIVVIGAFYAEAEDDLAFRSLPRRMAVFFCGCALLAALMLVLEHTFASIH